MPLPDFVIIGAMKCGTSTLAAQLGAQDGVFMTTPKEPNFFSDDAVFAQGLPWYESLFEAAAEKHPDKPIFVAVGAGHYPGPMGIIKLLEQTGFRVRPLHSVEAMEAAWPKPGAETSSRARPCPPRCCPNPKAVGPGY